MVNTVMGTVNLWPTMGIALATLAEAPGDRREPVDNSCPCPIALATLTKSVESGRTVAFCGTIGGNNRRRPEIASRELWRGQESVALQLHMR